MDVQEFQYNAMKTFNQLDPTILVEVVDNDLDFPVGKGRAIAIIDYGPEDHLLWVVFMDENRQCWQVPNPYVRAQTNPSLGRK